MSAFPPLSLRPVLQEVASLLKNNQQTISIAETAAGGIISAALLSIPGASTFYRGGLTIYTLESRVAFAGWTQDNVKAYKGPTPEVVAGMATHVRGQLDSTFTLCESGIAGPTGSTARWTRTPGYVALAVASKDGVVTRDVSTGSDDREANMVAFAEAGLVFLRDVLKGDVSIPVGKL
ncbi:competence/damage-inducible CinA family protein [Gautieria morchelliformis]|nr:competence/damage-inducible CinA family protein [Gautieria morchelliformis]